MKNLKKAYQNLAAKCEFKSDGTVVGPRGVYKHKHKHNGYVTTSTTFNGKVYYISISRLILFEKTGQWPVVVDHINGDRSDNRIENLRDVSFAQNARNKSESTANKSGFKGVYEKRGGKWYMECVCDGVRTRKGGFNSKEIAAAAYNIVAKSQHGEFSKLNEGVEGFENEALKVLLTKKLKGSIEVKNRKEGKSYHARIQKEGRRVYLGTFKTRKEAQEALKKNYDRSK